jgi:hypothetical protein
MKTLEQPAKAKKTPFQRNNEFRQCITRIQARYGEKVVVCDCIDYWKIYTPVRVGCGIYDVEERTHWRGENLRDALR